MTRAAGALLFVGIGTMVAAAWLASPLAGVFVAGAGLVFVSSWVLRDEGES